MKITNKIKKIFFKITGGRPMQKLQHAFVDVVSGEDVFYYKDRLNGKNWLANGSCDLSRVETNIKFV